MKKNYLTLLAVLFSLSFIHCSDDDDDSNSSITSEFSLFVSTNNVQLFEPTRILLGLKDEPNIFDWGAPISNNHLNIKPPQYDSIIWNIDNILRIKNPTNGSSTISWPQSFIRPGTYKLYLDRYLNGVAYSTDTTIINVGNQKDFIAIKWSEDNTKKYFFNSFNDGFIMNLYFYNEPTQYAVLEYDVFNLPGTYLNLTTEEYYNGLKSSRKYLSDYISELYGKPLFLYDKEDITQSLLENEYHDRFNIPLNKVGKNELPHIPLAIWETESTNMALLAMEITPIVTDSIEYKRFFYKVIGAPKN